MPLLAAFQDTDLGQVVGIVLHTGGAIGLLGALVAYLAWQRHLWAGDANPRVWRTAAVLTYASAVANLAGGFLRTYQEGHPGLSSLASSPWVQVMLIKHIFIFAGIAAMVYLVEFQAPRLRRLHDAGRLHKAPALGHQFGVLVVVAGIVVATLLGALSQITDLGTEAMLTTGPDASDDAQVQTLNFTGSLTSLPLQQAESIGGFQVPRGTAGLVAVLSWSDPVAALTLVLEATGPEGGGARGGSYAGEAGAAQGDLAVPDPGAWNFRVQGDNAINTAWRLQVRLEPAAADEGATRLAETVSIAPGQFFEINTEMENQSTIAWDWYAWQGQELYFDLHSHFGDEVQTYEEGTYTEHRGAYTAERKGGYSLLWANEGEAPVTLTYQAWGDFVVDSYFPPR